MTESKILAREEENKYQEKNAGAAISAAESLIITLKQKGINIETPNSFLDQAKTAFEIKEFKKSILFASKAKMTAKKLQPETESIPDGSEDSSKPTETAEANLGNPE